MGRGVLRNPAGFDRALRAWSRIPLGGSACLVLHLVASHFWLGGCPPLLNETWQNSADRYRFYQTLLLDRNHRFNIYQCRCDRNRFNIYHDEHDDAICVRTVCGPQEPMPSHLGLPARTPPGPWMWPARRLRLALPAACQRGMPPRFGDRRLSAPRGRSVVPYDTTLSVPPLLKSSD